ncbi:acetamidase/formamidase family protein [Acidipila sp. EB88]|uniref:acetamidase/formamidase family protein n=1 Tax=Acidipila sp. EB88 TaxID=2305226 RepID=UPI000F5E0C83|nr:acetamidase/formamidase family protein [Acidipila sp. EB88]RRA49452.1 acetamidase [Acidipila sp. EB88]
MHRSRLLCALASCLVSFVAPVAASAQQRLDATPTTVAWGYYSAHAKPVLTVKSGDTVVVHTLSTCGDPDRLKGMGIAAADIPASVTALYDAKGIDKGPGGHILTGPIAIESAEPGDVLEVQIQKIDIDVPWACNGFGAGRGFLPDDYPYGIMKRIPLDRQRMVAEFAPGIEIPLHPFFGSMGDAPPESAGRYNSAPPWMHGGNMDNKELVAGTTLYLPVHAKGALFEVGDGHAGQGNGEVDITALETMLTGTFRFVVHKGGPQLLWPYAETPTAYITMGFSPDLEKATQIALHNMLAFLETEKHLTRDQAYQLSSVAVDLVITQLVDTNVGVHAILPKALFTQRARPGSGGAQ